MKIIVNDKQSLYNAINNGTGDKLIVVEENSIIEINDDPFFDQYLTARICLKFEFNSRLKFIDNGRFRWFGRIEFYEYSQYILDITNSNDPENAVYGHITNSTIKLEWFGAQASNQYNIFREDTPSGGAVVSEPNYSRINDLIYRLIPDNTLQFKCALNLAKAIKRSKYDRVKNYSNGKIIQLEAGFYGISETLMIPNGIELIGYGPTKTAIIDKSEDGLHIMFRLRDTRYEPVEYKLDENGNIATDTEGNPIIITQFGNYIRIKNLGIRGFGSNEIHPKNWKTNHLIYAFECVYSIVIDNCRIEKGKNLVKLENCFGDVRITNSNLSYASNGIINLIKCHGFKLDHCRVEVCKNFDSDYPDNQDKHDAKPSAAIQISGGGQPVLIQNTIVQFNSGYGIYARGVNLLNISSCYFEDNFIFTSGENIDVGCQIMITESVQANIIGNSFTQERPNQVDNVNPPNNYAVRVHKSRIFHFTGNRVTNNTSKGGNMTGAYIIGGKYNDNIDTNIVGTNNPNETNQSNFIDL
ncbi:hypothetical protein [Aquimarina sp. RZ0]|uniref:hypothetical protein n=1 Tax=Aquimarina sp. RZ0 TaxID=2607730 RepID=UPI0011F362FC|nr:hypothetical protein [Aquimarina sp. RZ0]KAA1240773.1 hypothetical protein F0000_26900 [Aquimarina sp. RZ0]